MKLSDPPILTPSTPQDSATPSNRTATNRSTALSAFASTFVAIFLAEFGDKTQVAVLLMAAESHEPWVVFVGAATALIATSLVGVLVGRLLARWVSVKTLETIVGAILLMVSTSLLWEAVVGG
ncbi:MAG TPA: TMEM165/GDT1 family protein [Coleofasciculaceae cyanobacterium]